MCDWERKKWIASVIQVKYKWLLSVLDECWWVPAGGWLPTQLSFLSNFNLISRILNTFLTIKLNLRLAVCPWWALVFHLGHSKVPCVSRLSHLLFSCSSLASTSFTCGTVYQQWSILVWYGEPLIKYVGQHPALDGHSRDTRRALTYHLGHSKSLVFHFSHTCHSLVPLSFTHLSLVGNLVSKVSSECFITDL